MRGLTISIPVVYDQHVRFANFSSLGLHPAYINVVREPVDRTVSSYYYATHGRRSAHALRAAHERRGNTSQLTVDQCLALPLSLRRCGFNGDINLMTAFFCGHAAVCRCVGHGAKASFCGPADREAALARAMTVARHEFILVGLQSRLPETLYLLEKMLPAAFRGVSALPLAYERRTNYSKPSPKSRQQLQSMLDLDTRLYTYISRLFDARARACREPEQQPQQPGAAPRRPVTLTQGGLQKAKEGQDAGDDDDAGKDKA